MSQPLNAFAAEKRLAIFEQLKQGLEPAEGTWDATLLKEARAKSQPQLGSTRYEPDAVLLEFIYPDSKTNATVLTVRIQTPERVVFLPVPEWVVESIWQGDVDGTYHFESEARSLISAFTSGLEPEANREWFGPRKPKRRE